MTEPDMQPLIEGQAYRLWQEKGCPAGQDLDLWLEAEAAVRRALQAPLPGPRRPTRRKASAVALEPVAVETAAPVARARRPRAAKA